MVDASVTVVLSPLASLGKNGSTVPRVVFVASPAQENGAAVALGCALAPTCPLLQGIKNIAEAGNVSMHCDNGLWILVGIGSPSNIKAEAIRRAVHTGLEKVRDLKEMHAVIVLPGRKELSLDCDVAVTVAEVIPLSNYYWQEYVTVAKRRKNLLTSVTIATADGEADEDRQKAVAKAVSVSQCACYARDLGNQRTNKANCEYYEQEAMRLGREFASVKVKALQYEEMKALGLGLICAVGQGSKCKPRLLLLDYQGGAASEPYTCLVGKGVVFDTGGYNIKGTGHMETMYMDMCGAATVLATMKAVAKLGTLKANLLGVLCLAENSVSSEAYLPSCMLHSYKGLTVEVTNTDCEGRLVLADGMAYAQRNWPVATLIDVATLTSCNMIALGEHTAGMYTNAPAVVEAIKIAASRVGESVWHMPILDDHREEMLALHSDLRNKGTVYGGGCNAAAFLERFIEDGVAWVHLDIHGPAQYGKQRWYQPVGATGYGVRTMCAYLGL